MMGSGEITRNVQFLLFPQYFLSVWRTFCQFHQSLNCHLQILSVWKCLKFIGWERVNRTIWRFRAFSPFPSWDRNTRRLFWISAITGTAFLIINAPGAMQNLEREPILQSKMSVKFSISLCFRDYYDRIVIKLE